MRLNLGCGANVVQGWINVDYGLGARFAKLPLFASLNRKLGLFNLDWDKRVFIHDLTKQFPWDDDTAEVAYSSHTLEHLTREQGRIFLAECRRVLKPAGIIRIVVPDLAHTVDKYVSGRLRADHFVEALGVLSSVSAGSLRKLLSPLVEHPHKCMYDQTTLLEALDETGFEAVPKGAFDSAIQGIDEIELAARTRNAVIVEGKKITTSVT